MEDDFARLYQCLLALIEPDPVRLRRRWSAVASGLSGTDSPDPVLSPLHSSQKYDILGSETEPPGMDTQESGESKNA